MRYLLFGKDGQLGKAFEKFFSIKGLDYVGLNHDDIDIGSLMDTYELVKKYKPKYIINCTAYTDVDGAETSFIKANRVNGLGAKNLSFASKKTGAFLVHYSTDYIFDGARKNGLYKEDDEPHPVNRYGESKLFGEELIKEDLEENYLIFRLSWLFGDGKQNFIHKIIEAGKKNKDLRVVSDEVSIPTFTETVVALTIKSLEKKLSGVYHITSSDYCSRYEWAKEIFKILGEEKNIASCKSSDFDLIAKRPAFSAMSNEKISKALNIKIPDWKHETKKFINKYIINSK